MGPTGYAAYLPRAGENAHARPRLRRDEGKPRARPPLHADRRDASAHDRLVEGARPVALRGEGHFVESRWLADEGRPLDPDGLRAREPPVGLLAAPAA